MKKLLYFAIIVIFFTSCKLNSKELSESLLKKTQLLEKFLIAAKYLSRQKTIYSPAYINIPYPMGDVPKSTGVCTDLVIRAYRAINIDLQKLLHEDMKKNFNKYPSKQLYGLKKPDKNIDHRRVPNLMTFFKKHGIEIKIKNIHSLKNLHPGLIVVFDLYNNGRPTHIGIISDKKDSAGFPKVCHHFPPYPAENSFLTLYKILGVFKFPKNLF